MERDKRLGLKNGANGKREYPQVTITGAQLPQAPYTTIGLEGGYFVVSDTSLKPAKRDSILLELQGIIQSYAAPKKSLSKTVEPSE